MAMPAGEFAHVVALVDRRAGAELLAFRSGGATALASPLGQLNSSDPMVLAAFLDWGLRRFPGARSALVIWSHGTGVRDLPPGYDFDLLRFAERAASRASLSRAIFASTLERLVIVRPKLRGVVVDSTDRSYLDGAQLREALRAGCARHRPLDLIGLDACLMQTIEVAYQLRGLATTLVGSPEEQRAPGWPYGAILTGLAAEPTIDGPTLGRIIVREAATEAAHLLRRPVRRTVAALDLGQVEALFELTRVIATGITASELMDHGCVRQALRDVRTRVKRYGETKNADLADLRDWCKIVDLGTRVPTAESLREPLKTLRGALDAAEGPVLGRSALDGDDAARAGGLAIYWPTSFYSPVYDDLDFARSGWGELIRAALRVAAT
ncbi:hypothetical protein EKD04_022265 [Chloroflexales bacterium ZM16-3]|nr:hypothetical protein [Chloroflexales bacterium ZM16-3]